MELKDKFRLDESFEKKLAHVQEEAAGTADSSACTEAVQALVALGYSGTEALQAVKKVTGAEQMDAEAILKAALKYIF